jgi:hypothetical protein
MKSAEAESIEQVFLRITLNTDIKNKYLTYSTASDLSFLEATRRSLGELSNTHNKIKTQGMMPVSKTYIQGGIQ